MADPAESRPGLLARAAGAVRRWDASAWALLAANLIPIAGVVFLGWDAAFLVVLYWAENVVIGFFNVLKMAFVPAKHPVEHTAKLFLIPFFFIHYGGFCGGHGLFVVFLTGMERGAAGASAFPDGGSAWWGPLVFLQLLCGVVAGVIRIAGRELVWPFVALVASHGVSFVQHYLRGGERLRREVGDWMAAPYGRIIVLHIALLAGAVPVMLLGSPAPLLLVMVGMKIALDLRQHAKSHARPGGETQGVENRDQGMGNSEEG